MKKCIVISDSFKETLTSGEICAIAREKFAEILPDCELIALPVADGGEGTVDCFVDALGCERHSVETTGPYGERISAHFALHDRTAFLEIASVAGLPLVGDRRNPAETTSFGLGEIIKSAINMGATRLIIGLGGSATNDGGCGLAAALGTRFYDNENREIIPNGKALRDIDRIDNSATRSLLSGVEVLAMCDVTNPLYGKNGAAYVYAPQKGANDEMLEYLDRGLRHLSEVIKRDLGLDVSEISGAGAAGGIGGGVMAFLGGTLRQGIDVVLETLNFSALLDGCDLVITGEGCLDEQSLMGKLISGVLRETKAKKVPAVALVGGIKIDTAPLKDRGLSAVYSINPPDIPIEEAKKHSFENYSSALESLLCKLK